VRALPLVTFFFSQRIEEVKFREQILLLLIISHIVVEQNGAGKESSSSLIRMAAMPTTKEKGQPWELEIKRKGCYKLPVPRI
jgi:hypothetical protein